MRNRWVWLALALGAGCGSTTVILKEPRPLQISAKVPEQEPEKPEEPPPRVEVKEDVVDVKETILFEYSGWGLAKESHDILDEVARVLNAHPELKRLRIEGHTDTQGGVAENLRLSKKRANNVMKYLVGQGVAAGRLVSEGYGVTKPIADNGTDEGRAKNRRVVFTILEKAKKVDKDDEKPAKKDDKKPAKKDTKATKDTKKAAEPDEETDE
ncbi:MAG: OmpA family protein [Deltaproteobacteria bacterium]|nr:OmpA family protein [Deltaproteobacteria bacterium]